MDSPPAASSPPAWRLQNSYAGLPACFHQATPPEPVKAPRLICFNRPLAVALGLPADELEGVAGAVIFGGNEIPKGAKPIAQAYAGHQFGHFTKLGDGRAVLLGEQRTPEGALMDIQLKGSGRTPYSRRGDGRAALGPMLREYVISEAMHALGIPTTRSLAVVATGELVRRETPLPGAVLTRVAASHIRIGTFEWAAAEGSEADLRALADYTLHRHFPEQADNAKPYLALLEAVMERQASLIAQWQQVGFIHGVMNTDNMALSGETIDYGPCAFMDAYSAETVFSSIDHRGRYAYGNQAPIAQWNLARLAETLLPLLAADKSEGIALANQAIEGFRERFEVHWLARMRAKLGLFDAAAEDAALIDELLAWMQQQRADFTNTFRALSVEAIEDQALLTDRTFMAWHQKWSERRAREARPITAVVERMRSHNPVVIPRNHQVEAALTTASEAGDLAPLHRLLAVLAEPYTTAALDPAYTRPPKPNERVYQTFCGT